MPADVKFKVDADISGYVGKVSQMADAQKQVSGHMEKQIDLSHAMQHGLQRTLFHSIAIVTVFREMVAALNEGDKKLIELTRKLDESRLKDIGNIVEIAGPQGATSYQRLIEGGQGPTTREQMSSFVASLANFDRERTAKHLPKLSQQTVNALTSSYLHGGEAIFPNGAKELFNLVEDKNGGEYDIQNRINAYVSRQYALPPNTPDPIQAALKALPKNIKPALERIEDEKQRDYRNSVNADYSGHLLERADAALENIYDSNPFLRFYGSTLGVVTGWISRRQMAWKLKLRDEQEDLIRRKVIAHDRHAEDK